MMVSSAELKEHIQGVRGEVQLLNYEEALAYAKGRPYEHELDKMMNQEKLPFSKAQMYPDFILGKCLIDEGTVDHPKQIYAVYCLTPETLLLITPKKDEQILYKILANTESEKDSRPQLFFLRFLEQTLQDDTEYLQKIEEECYDMEEDIYAGNCKQNPAPAMLSYREAPAYPVLPLSTDGRYERNTGKKHQRNVQSEGTADFGGIPQQGRPPGSALWDAAGIYGADQRTLSAAD